MGLTLIHVFIVILAGVALGSFASALSWRVPRGISWTHGRKNQQDKNGISPARRAMTATAPGQEA